MKADLHIHTTASDGAMSPSEVVKWAKASNIEVMAVTDHDTVSGIDEAKQAASVCGVKFVPGIEISAFSICEVHVLGYNIDYKNEGFISELEQVKRLRIERNMQIGQKLRDLGAAPDMDFSAEGLGRMNIAREMVKQGVVKDVQEAFDKYLGVYGKAYSAAKRMTPLDAVKLIKKYGGFASVAHPKKYLLDKRLEPLAAGLKKFGLDGIEVNYPGHSPQDIAQLETLAKRYGLLPTGGSDFHGEEDKKFTFDLDPRLKKALKIF